MARFLTRVIAVIPCLLGTVLVCSIHLGWPPQPPISGIVYAQSNPAASTKTVITPVMRDFDPVFIWAVRSGPTELRGAQLTEDEIRAWFVPSGMAPRPAKPSRLAYRFQAGDDWLENLSFRAVNRTGKKIVRIKLGVKFPEIKQAGGKGLFAVAPEAHDAQFMSLLRQAFDGTLEMKRDESGKEIKRLLRVFSLRDAKHKTAWMPFDITDRGIFVRSDVDLRCVMCSRIIDWEPHVEVIGGKQYNFDTTECANTYKKFKKLYGESFE